MKSNLREECEQRRDLVAYNLRGVIVSVVHQGDTFVHVQGRVAQGKLGTSDRVSLNADPEDFALDAGFDFAEVVRLGQDFINGLAVTNSRADPVSRDIFEAVARPDVHDAKLP